MKNSIKSLFECISIFICGVGALSAAATAQRSAHLGFICAALVLGAVAFVRYRWHYVSLLGARRLTKAQHYGIELLKSFMLFTCGEVVGFSLFKGRPLVGSMFLLCAALICVLAYQREAMTQGKQPV